LTASEGLGPSPSFTQVHVFLAFLVVGDSTMIGRQALAKETGVGPGAVRTILKKLTESRYVETIASGCRLTSLGRQVHAQLRRILSQVVFLDAASLSVGRVQASARVKGGGRRLGSGIEQRDAAILVGASGATTYAIRNGRFTIPGGSRNCEKDFPSPAWRVLRSELQLREGDAVVLCGAEDAQKARVGTVSAALTLL
jgi:hypothetical protein